MHEEVKELYEKGIKNKVFLISIEKADGDAAPLESSPHNEKVMFAMLYYGWLVGKYEDNWKSYM